MNFCIDINYAVCYVCVYLKSELNKSEAKNETIIYN